MNTDTLPPGWCIADAQVMAKLRWAKHIFATFPLNTQPIHAEDRKVYCRALEDLRSALYSMQWRDREDKK